MSSTKSAVCTSMGRNIPKMLSLHLKHVVESKEAPLIRDEQIVVQIKMHEVERQNCDFGCGNDYRKQTSEEIVGKK